MLLLLCSKQEHYIECDRQEENSCHIDAPFNRTVDTDILYVKVNASNNFGNATSAEIPLNLHHIGKFIDNY